ncbi:hypothetical protein BDZ97DRAFT_68151 [Flammula alnicola]|nr:hypothetical protein BDZ97DRAFT_68151 [Flammula alnicola]
MSLTPRAANLLPISSSSRMEQAWPLFCGTGIPSGCSNFILVLSAHSGAIDDLGGVDAHSRGGMSRHTTQVYDLYRGRTAAVVEDLDWARDGRWLAVGTWNRTIHIFPVNPYGGKSDIRSHMDGRVRNVDIIRQPRWLGYVDLRTRVLSAERPDAPLAFMLISAYSSGGGESAFFKGFSSPQDIRVSSSFDELVASAISSSVDNSNLPAILPMYPNGVPGSKSFRNSAYSHPNDGWDWGRRRRGYWSASKGDA